MATGALPTAIGIDPEASKEYFDALNQSLKALEGRQEPNLLNLAGAFLAPGRTGSFGEALGNAASVMGKQQEEREAREPAIGQMRAALAGQKFEASKQQKALEIAAGAMGINPAQAQQILASGKPLPQDMMQKLANVHMPISQLYPALATAIKDQFAMQKDMADIDIKKQNTILDALRTGSSVSEAAFKTGTNPTEYLPDSFKTLLNPGQSNRPTVDVLPYPVEGAKLTSGYGERNVPNGEGTEVHPAVDFGAPLGSPIKPVMPGTVVEAGTSPSFGNFVKVKASDGSVVQYSHMQGFGDTIKPGATVDYSTELGQVGNTGKSTGPHVDVRAYTPDGKPFNLQPYFGKPQQPVTDKNGYTDPSGNYVSFPSGTTPAGQEALRLEASKATIGVSAKSQEESNKYWNTQKDDIYTQGAPHTVSRLRENIEKVWETAENYPAIYGQLAGQGFFNALASSLQKGPNTSFGEFSGNVEDFIAKLKLDDPLLAIKTDIARTMSQIFFDNSQVAKTVLGRFTDQDARLAQAPLASLKDPAKSVIHWAGESLIALQQREKANELLHDWERTHKGVPIKEFFNSREYKKIFSDASTEMKEWRKTSPLYKVE